MIAAFGWRGRLVAGSAIAATLLYLAIVVMRYLAERDVAPFWDLISVEQFLDRKFLPDMNFFTAFTFLDNQHRPVFPLYVFAIDHIFFASHGPFPLLLSWTSIAGVCLISLHRLTPAIEDRATRLGFLLLFPSVMFWPANYDNLVWAKQLHACLALLCSCAAFSLAAGLNARMAASMTRGDAFRLWLIPPLVFVGAFSFAWGLIAACVLAGFVLWHRWPLRRAAPVLVGVAVTLGVYSFTWQGMPHGPYPPGLGNRLTGALEYLLINIGEPFWWLSNGAITSHRIILFLAGCFGAIGIVLTLWSLGRRWHKEASQPRNRAADSYAQLLVLFGLSCALTTMSGRFQGGLLQATTSRYLFVPCLFWLALPFVVPNLSRIHPAARRLPLALIVGTAVAVAATAPACFSYIADRAATIRLGAIAAVMGESGVGAPPRLHPKADAVVRVFNDYAAHGTAVYAEAWPRWLGQPTALVVPPDVTACRGALDISQPVPESSDTRLDGWIWDPFQADAQAWLALAGREGHIIGLATNGFPGPALSPGGHGADPLPDELAKYLRNDRPQGFFRPDIAAATRPSFMLRAGFVGYLRGDPTNLTDIYGWFGGNDWCRLTIAG